MGQDSSPDSALPITQKNFNVKLSHFTNGDAAAGGSAIALPELSFRRAKKNQNTHIFPVLPMSCNSSPPRKDFCGVLSQSLVSNQFSVNICHENSLVSLICLTCDWEIKDDSGCIRLQGYLQLQLSRHRSSGIPESFPLC